jgi:hypothetical protein
MFSSVPYQLTTCPPELVRYRRRVGLSIRAVIDARDSPAEVADEASPERAEFPGAGQIDRLLPDGSVDHD